MDRDSQPLVSVILPVYNGEKYIRDAIASVLCQRYEKLELVVVDDGSTDGTAAILSQYGDTIRHIRQVNSGASEARNVGLSAAAGTLIGFVDADDLWATDKLTRQIADLTSDKNVRVVLGKTQLFQMRNSNNSAAEFLLTPELESGETLFAEEIRRSVPCVSYLLGAGLFKRDVIEQVGKFDPTLQITHDTDWFMRLREIGITVFHEDFVSLHYRRNPEGLTANKELLESEMFRVFRTSLNRRREPGKVEASALTATRVLNSVQSY